MRIVILLLTLLLSFPCLGQEQSIAEEIAKVHAAYQTQSGVFVAITEECPKISPDLEQQIRKAKFFWIQRNADVSIKWPEIEKLWIRSVLDEGKANLIIAEFEKSHLSTVLEISEGLKEVDRSEARSLCKSMLAAVNNFEHDYLSSEEVRKIYDQHKNL